MRTRVRGGDKSSPGLGAMDLGITLDTVFGWELALIGGLAATQDITISAELRIKDKSTRNFLPAVMCRKYMMFPIPEVSGSPRITLALKSPMSLKMSKHGDLKARACAIARGSPSVNAFSPLHRITHIHHTLYTATS